MTGPHQTVPDRVPEPRGWVSQNAAFSERFGHDGVAGRVERVRIAGREQQFARTHGCGHVTAAKPRALAENPQAVWCIRERLTPPQRQGGAVRPQRDRRRVRLLGRVGFAELRVELPRVDGQLVARRQTQPRAILFPVSVRGISV